MLIFLPNNEKMSHLEKLDDIPDYRCPSIPNARVEEYDGLGRKIGNCESPVAWQMDGEEEQLVLEDIRLKRYIFYLIQR